MTRLALVLALAAACGTSSDEPAPHHEDRHEPMAAPGSASPSLAVTVDGKPATWEQAVFDTTPHFATANKDGEARDTWSLRELVGLQAGVTARVTAVIGDPKKTIDAASWADTSRTPILHRTRRGALKFRWADASGKWGETEVKDVTGLEITTR